MSTSEQKVPRNACAFEAVLDIDLERHSEDAKTAPFSMLARSGDPIDHWFWGRAVHDMDGLQHKHKIPIDYNHNADEIVGYANKFRTDGGNLNLSGAMVPYKDSDRASEILAKSAEGIPYEASIFFDSAKVEKVADGVDVTVNDRQLTGPLTIFREWTLRGVAITPYGYDPQTYTALSRGDEITVTVEEPETMSADDTRDNRIEDTTDPAEETDQVVDTAEVDHDSSENDAAPVVAATSDVEEQPADTLSAPGERFMEAFGETQGAVYFAKGVTFEDAQTQELARLRAENEELRQRVSAAASEGVEDAVAFSQTDGKKVLDKIPARIIE